MASVINTNIASLNTQRSLSMSQGQLNTALQRLSSGLRINSSKDDAAGLAIATRMDSQIRGQQVAIRNANDAISFAQTAEGGLQKQTDAIQRMRELAVQSANATNTAADRTNLQAEFSQLQTEVTRLNTATKFNGSAVFGSAAKVYQVGADTADTISVSGTTALTGATGSIASASGATAAITALDAALVIANTNRATLGAIQNRFDSVVSNLQVSVENQSAAKSRIMDADFAAETANLTRGQILQQAGTAMLAQANSLPNGVLALLRG
ncbi:MAG: flagellin [Methylotenera sp.]|nr:flagellin [Methylotenera sp.]